MISPVDDFFSARKQDFSRRYIQWLSRGGKEQCLKEKLEEYKKGKLIFDLCKKKYRLVDISLNFNFLRFILCCNHKSYFFRFTRYTRFWINVTVTASMKVAETCKKKIY